MNKIRSLWLKNQHNTLEIKRVETDEDAALLWEEDMHNTVTNNLTFVLKHSEFNELEAIYERSTNNLFMYNIALDRMDKHNKIVVDTGNIVAELDLTDLEESFKLSGIPRIDTDGTKVFATPTYEMIDENGNKVEVELWLHKYGHRINQMHIKYI